jgi:hypothetical protein
VSNKKNAAALSAASSLTQSHWPVNTRKPEIGLAQADLPVAYTFRIADQHTGAVSCLNSTPTTLI